MGTGRGEAAEDATGVHDKEPARLGQCGIRCGRDRIVRGQKPPGGVPGDHERLGLDRRLGKSSSDPGQGVLEDPVRRRSQRVLVARDDHGIAAPGKVVDPRAIVARLGLPLAVQKDQTGEGSISFGATDDRRCPGAASDGEPLEPSGATGRLRIAVADQA